MPKTDAEWQTLADRIAREVMKYEAKPYRGGWVYSVPSAVHAPTIMDALDWRPHKDVAQAVLARDRIVEQGWDFVLGASLSGQRKVLVVASFVPEAGVGMFESERSAETDGKAICLAIERWLDAQKEEQDAQD